MHTILFVDDDQTTTILIARKLKPYSAHRRRWLSRNAFDALGDETPFHRRFSCNVEVRSLPSRRLCRIPRNPYSGARLAPQTAETLQAGACYLISAQESLALVGRGNALTLTASDTVETFHGKAADRLMVSAARIFCRTAVGLILSGNDGDGVEGLRSIRDAGGAAVALSPEGSLFSETVHMAVQHGLVDRFFSNSLVNWHRSAWSD